MSLVHTEASRSLADDRSIVLREFLDALLGREQLAEEGHVKDVAWFDERYNALDSQRAAIQVQQPTEQESTKLGTLEQTLERRKTKLRLSELRELGQLTTIANLEQDIEQTRTDGNALLQEKIDLQQICVAIQDDALALPVDFLRGRSATPEVLYPRTGCPPARWDPARRTICRAAGRPCRLPNPSRGGVNSRTTDGYGPLASSPSRLRS